MRDDNKDISSHDLSEEEKRKLVMGDETENNKSVENDPALVAANKMADHVNKQGLGNVRDMHKSDNIEDNDMSPGWHSIVIEDMPSMGKFYPENTKIHIRSADGAEIRQWSTLNESDLFDVDNKLNYIIQKCTKIKSGNKLVTWKDILEDDRFYIILAIRDLTFKDGENKLQVTKECPSCGEENKIDIINENLIKEGIPEDIEKYYDSEERLYNIKTKSFGEIKMRPPTIGVYNYITGYIQEKRSKGESWDESFMQLYPYLRLDWRGLNDKVIFDAEVGAHGWNGKKVSLIYRIAEMMKVGIKPDVRSKCTSCGEEVTAEINFQSGIKAIFIPTISDISEELL